MPRKSRDVQFHQFVIVASNNVDLLKLALSSRLARLVFQYYSSIQVVESLSLLTDCFAFHHSFGWFESQAFLCHRFLVAIVLAGLNRRHSFAIFSGYFRCVSRLKVWPFVFGYLLFKPSDLFALMMNKVEALLRTPFSLISLVIYFNCIYYLYVNHLLRK